MKICVVLRRYFELKQWRDV